MVGFFFGQISSLQQETNWHENSLQSARLLHFFFLSFLFVSDGSEGININYSYLFLVLNILNWQKLKQRYPLLLRVWAWKQRQCWGDARRKPYHPIAKALHSVCAIRV